MMTVRLRAACTVTSSAIRGRAWKQNYTGQYLQNISSYILKTYTLSTRYFTNLFFDGQILRKVKKFICTDRSWKSHIDSARFYSKGKKPITPSLNTFKYAAREFKTVMNHEKTAWKYFSFAKLISFIKKSILKWIKISNYYKCFEISKIGL